VKIKVTRINHITIAAPAGEHDKVRAFYGELLGLEEIPHSGSLTSTYDLIWYKFLDILIHIDFTPPWTQSAENRHVAMEVEDLAAIRR
jgi:catechol 2,3-dioxygenase-like lactoylglutathione lyase family enzyme